MNDFNHANHTDFTGLLNNELQEVCEQEFQSQMHHSKGELFLFTKSSFSSIDLTIPNLISQAILQYFADCGCPLSGIRLAISLHPHEHELWPVRSVEMSFRYLFSSIECMLNIRNDKRAKPAIYSFEQTHAFKQGMQLAACFINERSISSNICPELMTYVFYHCAAPTSLH